MTPLASTCQLVEGQQANRFSPNFRGILFHRLPSRWRSRSRRQHHLLEALTSRLRYQAGTATQRVKWASMNATRAFVHTLNSSSTLLSLIITYFHPLYLSNCNIVLYFDRERGRNEREGRKKKEKERWVVTRSISCYPLHRHFFSFIYFLQG